MIAEPDSTIDVTQVSRETHASPAPRAVERQGALSADELYRLTLYKWRYSLEAFGFESDEVRKLMFVKWLHASRRVLP